MCFLLGREEEQVAKKVPNASKPRTPAARGGAVAQPRKAGAVAPAQTATPPARPTVESLDGAVDSLRRLLSELLEQRVESIARELADVRRTLATGDLATGLDQLDDLLDSLGAVRFSAEPFDVVDPLIHTVVAERPGNGVPRGVVLEAVRPGFRSSRGLVLAKAAVAVSVG
jgi:3-oxoacyl-ACP reductase-like protein